jgi:hypothetical protein
MVKEPERDLAEWDLLCGLVLAQLTAARRQRGKDEWLTSSALERAVRELGRGGARAVQSGWPLDAERRGLVTTRSRGGTLEVRMQSRAELLPWGGP